MSIIDVKNLYKVFGAHPEKAFPLIEQGKSKEDILDKTGCTVAINNASFSVEKKEVFVLMGLSGSGKSTVIRCLNRLIEPTKGEVLINGDNIVDMSQEKLREIRRNKMSMVFQNFGLFPHRSVVSNVEYGLEIGGMEKAERREKAMEALDKVGLKGYEFSLPSELSGGMQQRVGLARALANDPEVLLMDEAFSALDPLIRTQMQDELLDLQAELHKTIVFITHDLDEALKLGDRIAILGSGGRVIQIGTAEDILTNPADDYVRTFVQNVNRTKVITASTLMRKPNTITVPKDGPGVAIRQMEKQGLSTIFVVDSERRMKGLVSIDDAVKQHRKQDKTLEPVINDNVYIVEPHTAIGDMLAMAMEAHYPIAVLGDDHKLLGVVDRATIIGEVENEEYSATYLSDALNGGDSGEEEVNES